LVAAVADALGIPRVEAIGWMAEHVVPDLGALIVCPPARHLGRTVRFANGMSANDPLSFRHNWRHVGLGAAAGEEPAKFVITVVNNRADRVARSRVFAGILANEADAHRHVFIGTNLTGLAAYFDEAVAERLSRQALDGDPTRVDALFAHLRLADAVQTAEVCGARLGVPETARREWADAVARIERTPRGWTEALEIAESTRKIAANLAEAPDADDLPDAVIGTLARQLAFRAARTAPADQIRAIYADVARASLHIVEDSHASGDAIIGRAVRLAPPGSDTWIMGVQNIKGTGLDFAYQWVWWRELHTHLVALASPDASRRAAALTAVEASSCSSVLALDAAIAALQPLADDPRLARRVTLLVERFRTKRDALMAERARGGSEEGRQSAFVATIERFLDPFDAIARRRQADIVFRDLTRMRISHRRAQAELRRLTVRQKGGWLGRKGK
jgi:hypothetical protein